jgi:hypothetical protein
MYGIFSGGRSFKVRELRARKEIFGGLNEFSFKTDAPLFPGLKVKIFTGIDILTGIVDQATKEEVRCVFGRYITDGYVIAKRFLYNDFADFEEIYYPQFKNIEYHNDETQIKFLSEPGESYSYTTVPSHLVALRFRNENSSGRIAKVTISGIEDVNVFFSHALLKYSPGNVKTGIQSTYGQNWTLSATNITDAAGILFHTANRLTGSYASVYYSVANAFSFYPYTYPATLSQICSTDSVLLEFTVSGSFSNEIDIFVKTATDFFDFFARTNQAAWIFEENRRITYIPSSSMKTFYIEDADILNFTGTFRRIYYKSDSGISYIENTDFRDNVYSSISSKSGYTRDAFYDDKIPVSDDFYREVLRAASISISVKYVKTSVGRTIPAILAPFPHLIALKSDLYTPETHIPSSIDIDYETGVVTYELVRLKDVFIV